MPIITLITFITLILRMNSDDKIMSRRNVTNNKNIKSKIRCLNTNAQSLQYKIAELTHVIKDKEAKIITITESWGEEWKEALLEIGGFSMYKKHRTDGRVGGGCITYISQELKSYACKELENVPGDDAVWCWVKPTKDTKILVGCIYRSPSSTPENNEALMNQILQAVEVAGKNRLLLMGDFNLKEINWSEDEAAGTINALPSRFYECIKDGCLNQHVFAPTRFRGEQQSTLDLVFTKEEEDVKNIEVIQPLGKSDHGIVVCDFICKWKENTIYRPRRLYHKGNYEKMNKLISEIDWETEFEGKCIHSRWDYFKCKMEEIENQCIPMSIPRRYLDPWMNRKVITMYKNKYFAWKRHMESDRSEKRREYVKERNKAKRIERDERRAYEKRLANEVGTNRRGFFKYVNSKLTVRPEISALMNENGELIHDEKEMANVCNCYFHSVLNRPSDDGEMPEMEDLCDENIRDIEITTEMVKRKLENLNRYKGSGPDKMHPHVLRETAASISLPLSMIFKESLSTGETPEDWRRANVTPIFKKGDRNDPANYRPVSLTSQVCKVLESLVKEKMFDHLKSKNLLSEEQHGFREGRSCLSNLLTTLEDWTKMLDDGDCVDVAYLDFRKAFDLVSHKHLLYKLQKHGINGQIGNWIKAFLENRKQKVVIRGFESDELDVLSGVPQGSVLGPILFLIFINDLPKCTTCPVCLFADDSKIYCRVPRTTNNSPKSVDEHNLLQKDLQELQKWATTWKMSFNVNKCKIMHLGYNNPKHEYSLDDIALAETVKERDLGVLIDNELKFSQHIKSIVAKANRMIGLIKISFESVDKDMFKTLYNALIRPLLEYCVHAWSPHMEGDIALLENVQRRATKLVRGLRDLEYEERLRILELPKLKDRRTRGDMILTYRLINGEEGIPYQKFFTLQDGHYDLRETHSKKIAKPGLVRNLEVRKFFFSQRIINEWNKLTEYEVSARSTSTFKVRYDEMEKRRQLVRRRNIYVPR